MFDNIFNSFKELSQKGTHIVVRVGSADTGLSSVVTLICRTPIAMWLLKAVLIPKFTSPCYLPKCEVASVTRWCIMDVPGSRN